MDNFTYKEGILFKNDKEIKISKNKRYTNVYTEGKFLYYHRIVFFLHHGFFPKCVDHINGNTRDNRIENLRASDPEKNNNNSTRVRGAKGYWKCKRSGKFVATINMGGKNKILGYFTDEVSAANAYRKERDAKCLSLFS